MSAWKIKLQYDLGLNYSSYRIRTLQVLSVLIWTSCPVYPLWLREGLLFGPHGTVCHFHVPPRRKRSVSKTLPLAIRPAWHTVTEGSALQQMPAFPSHGGSICCFSLVIFGFGLASISMRKVKISLARRSRGVGHNVYLCFYLCVY